MKNKNVILTCKSVIFYSPKDKEAFFEWIKKIGCIESFNSADNELYLHIIKSRAVSYINLDNLLGLFDRYKIDMTQLKQFLTKRNKEWFLQDERVFGESKPIPSKNVILVCKDIKFYSPRDEDIFFDWVRKLNCIETFYGSSDALYLHVTSNTIDDTDLDKLLGLFDRYTVDMKQLKQFLTKDNKEWFFDNKEAYWHKHVFGKDKLTQPKGEK